MLVVAVDELIVYLVGDNEQILRTAISAMGIICSRVITAPVGLLG